MSNAAEGLPRFDTNPPSHYEPRLGTPVGGDMETPDVVAPLRASTEDSASDEDGKYVYCIIRSSEERDFGAIGIGGEGKRVYTVRYRDLAAVVSDTPIRIYDPTRENVLR